MRVSPANDCSPFGEFRPHGALLRLLRFTQNAGLHWFGQRAALLVRGVGLRRLRARPVDVTVETLRARMRLYPYNNACEKRLLFTPQLSDREERRYLASRITPDMSFLDIGAGLARRAFLSPCAPGRALACWRSSRSRCCSSACCSIWDKTPPPRSRRWIAPSPIRRAW